MDKNLPRVYASPINKNINNNLDYYVSDNNREINNTHNEENILQKINEIFSSPHHVYKSNVHLKMLDNSETDATIVGKVNNYLLTLNGDKININKIAEINKI